MLRNRGAPAVSPAGVSATKHLGSTEPPPPRNRRPNPTPQFGNSTIFGILAAVNIVENVPLAPLTTFRVGGPARWFAEARTPQQVLEAVDTARANNWRLF